MSKLSEQKYNIYFFEMRTFVNSIHVFSFISFAFCSLSDSLRTHTLAKTLCVCVRVCMCVWL